MSDAAQLDEIQRPKKGAFLAAYAECGNITQAAKNAGVDRSSHYLWLANDEYAKTFKAAHDEACDSLEREARRRAVDGWDEPVFYEGEKCGVKRKFSDTLLIFLMKGNNPTKFGDRIEQTHKGEFKVDADVRTSIEQLHADTDYIEFLRQQALARGGDTSALCGVDQCGNGQPMGDGQASGDS